MRVLNLPFMTMECWILSDNTLTGVLEGNIIVMTMFNILIFAFEPGIQGHRCIEKGVEPVVCCTCCSVSANAQQVLEYIT